MFPAVFALALAAALPLDDSGLIVPEGFHRDALLDESFCYDYLEAGLSFGSDNDGIQLAASYRFEDRWFAIINSDLLDSDGLGRDPETKRFSAGLGYIYPHSKDLHFVSTLEWDYAQLDSSLSGTVGGDSFSESGVRFRERVRYAASDRLELFGGLGWTSLGDDDFLLEAGAVFATSNKWAIVAHAQDDSDQRITIGMRFAY